MKIIGGQEYMYAPQTGTLSKTAPFVAVDVAADGTETIKNNVIWRIISSSKGSMIGKDGVLIVTENYIAGDINGTDITIEAVDNDDETKTATATIHVREAQRVADFVISIGEANDAAAVAVIKAGEAARISISNYVDQYGEPITDTSFVSVKWEFSDENISVVDGKVVVDKCFVTGAGATNEATAVPAMIKATINGTSIEKKFLVTDKDGYVASKEDAEALNAADLKVVHKADVDLSVVREYDVDTYTYVNKNVEGKDSVIVDVKGMVNYNANTDYQITFLYEDGKLVQKDMRANASGELEIKLEANEGAKVVAVEASPVLKLSLGNCDCYSEEQGYIKVPAAIKYDGKNLYGFYGEAGDTANGVKLFDDTAAFVVALPNGFYDIRVTKSGVGRSTIKVNEGSLGTNVGNPGTGGREGTTPYTYFMQDVCVNDGTARISLGEKDYGLAAVEIRKATSLRPRRVHVYIGSDSTASNYYPIETAEPENGRYQTGWGQVFSQFVTDDIVVTNIAGGGTYAKSWYELAFPGVIKHAQPGDYFIIQEGINDRTYSNIDEMVVYLTKMIEECRAKGVIIVLATAMQTPKFWRDLNGNEVDEFGTPEGSGLGHFMNAIRALAKEKDVILVDSGKITGEWYSVIGRTFVEKNYHIYNKETDVREDTLHLSYMGAKNVAGVVATELLRQQLEGVTDGVGQNLDGLKFNEPVDYTVEFTGKDGKPTTATIKRVASVYNRYAI
ncbi:MAG: hypothetical protein IJW18_08375 [Lachnospiraceae bacterium]|nr:hypothetical protein [Lachnospiraceae bacterium]